MSCIKLFECTNGEASVVESVKEEIINPTGLYRSKFAITSQKLIHEYMLLNLFEGNDKIHTDFVDTTGVCCIVFNGDYHDLSLIKDYLNNRPKDISNNA